MTLYGKHFPSSLRLDLYVFGISGLRRMGSASKLIQIWHLRFFAPPHRTPGNSEIAKFIEVCPFTDTTNLALTVLNYLEYSEKVGLTDNILLSSLLSLLKQQRQDLHTRLNNKKKDLFAFFKSLTQVCTQTAEVAACRDYLGKFFRPPG